MAKYDGLIIPRSYSDYLNKTDGATLSQMLDSIGGTFDASPTPNSVKPARSGGIFAANAVITSDNATLIGVTISAGSVVRVLFTAALTGSDTTTGLTLTYNGNAYAVKVGKNGALVALTAHLIEESFVYLQAYTTLELAFDGSQFVVMGNPVVISNADFSIMADGSITYSESGIKSITRGIENINSTTYSATGNYELIKSIENFSFLLIGFECDGTGERTGYTLIPVEICKNRNNINYALVLDMYIGQNNNASAICYFPDTSHIAIYQLNVSGWDSIKLVVYGCI